MVVTTIDQIFFKMENYERIAPNGANLYVLKMENGDEKFWKIGISKDVSKRIKQLSRSGYSVKEGYYFFHNDSGLIYLIEKICMNIIKIVNILLC